MSTVVQGSKTSLNTFLPWIVWGLGCLFYFYESLLQVSPSVMSNELMLAFDVTGQTLGILAGIYFYSYAAMQLPCGVLLDYFGPRWLLALATTICAFSTIAFGMTSSFYMAILARTMIGLGSAFAAVGTLKLAANWFHAKKFATLTGLMITVGMLGSIGGQAPLAFLISKFGWRESMLILGAAGLVLTLLILTIVKDSPQKQIRKKAEEPQVLDSLKKLIHNKQLWLVAIYGGLMYMATPVFCGLWGVPFLMAKLSLSKTSAANLISLVFVGWAIAGPLWGIYSSRIGKRKPPLLIGSIGSLLSCLMFIYLPIHSYWLTGMILFAFGIFSSGFLPAFALAKELCDKRYVATGLSFMNMINMLGIALAQPAIGALLDHMWVGTYINKVRYYPMEAYQAAFVILPLGIFIALIIIPFIKETYCHDIDN